MITIRLVTSKTSGRPAPAVLLDHPEPLLLFTAPPEVVIWRGKSFARDDDTKVEVLEDGSSRFTYHEADTLAIPDVG